MTQSKETSERAARIEAELHAHPDRWTPRLDRLLREQLALCNELDELSRRQADLIEADDADALISVLSQRQGVLDRLVRCGEEFEPFRRRWDELMSALPAEDREGFSRRVDELSSLVRVVAERDERDRKALEEKRQAVTADLANVQRGRGAMTAYARPSQETTPSARFQDREG